MIIEQSIHVEIDMYQDKKLKTYKAKVGQTKKNQQNPFFSYR